MQLAYWVPTQNENLYTRAFIQGKMNKLNSSSHFIFSTKNKVSRGEEEKWSKIPNVLSHVTRNPKKSWLTGHTRQKKISTFFLNNLTCIFYVTEKSFYPFTFVSLPLYYQYKRLLIFVLHLPPKKYTHAMVLDLSQLYCHILNSYQLPSFW